MMRRIFRLAVVLTAAITFLVSAAGAQTDAGPDRTLSPYFFVKGDPGVDRLPLKETGVDIRVSGVIADVRVKQVYANDGSRPINAT